MSSNIFTEVGKYRQCTISVMDTIADPDITFDDKGISNYYYEYIAKNKTLPQTEDERHEQLHRLVEKIKAAGNGKPYDSIMGISGGVDSTYVAYLAKQHGLRPLAIHFDNGWNAAIADENIQNIIQHTGFDLKVVKMDGAEYRDIQLAYLKASVVDIEAPTDHAVFTTLFKIAMQHGIRYVLKGTNHQTEATMPKSWNFNKLDHINIRAIHKQFGTIPLKTFPMMDTKMKRWDMKKHALEGISLLHYTRYNKEEAKEKIKKEFDWKDYGNKHYESIWTRFYQGYILPVKFHIDKRKPHLSDLIFGGQMTKEAALSELEKPPYVPEVLESDKKIVFDRLGLDEDSFQKIMKTPQRSHYDFDYEMPLDKRYPLLKPVKKLYRTLFPVQP